MSTQDDYQAKLPEITVIPDEQLTKAMAVPVDTYVQEAENLFKWCQSDQEELTANGLAWDTLVVELPVRAGALREAESLWNMDRATRAAMAKQWANEAPVAYKLRDDLLRVFRFAFRDDEVLLKKVKNIAESSSHTDMLQDLNDLSVMGLKQPAPLAAINFDVALLDQAALKSDELATLLANVNSENEESRATKKVRDQAYAFLKDVVDEIYKFGKFAFRYNEERRNGYRSKYLYKKRLKRAAQTIPGDEPLPVEVPADVPQVEMINH